jgi:hypothetical protein
MKQDGELPGRVQVRSSQYLNNLVEQDHRRVKQRIRPILGFKRFDNAVVTISRNRIGREDQEGTVQDGQTRWAQRDDDGIVERGTRRLSPFAITQRAGPYPISRLA